MSFDAKHLYELLPALYRLRDAEIGRNLSLPGEGGPLKALVAAIAVEIGKLEDDLDQLYDDQFIETCAEWVVPYIGDLVGARGVEVLEGAAFGPRSEVANTLAYRRRKGTASMIEQLSRDVTGWNASVVEYFQLLATTQYMNHLRPGNQSVASVRNPQMLEKSGTPFDQIPRTADVRRIEPRRGKYNIPNIGIYLWRTGSYSLTKSPAFRVDGFRYTFNPLGLDLPLFNFPVGETDITRMADETNVPMPISRQKLTRNLDFYYGENNADDATKSLLVYAGGTPVVPKTEPVPQILTDLICVCDLSNVKDLSGNDVLDVNGFPVGWVNMPLDKIAVDPVLGRLVFPSADPAPGVVHVSYQYGFSAEMGGGEYGREKTFTEKPEQIIQVSKTGPQTIQQAIDQLVLTGGVVEIMDNERYAENLSVEISTEKTIELRATNKQRPILELSGDLTIFGAPGSVFILNGILVTGGAIRIPETDAGGESNELAQFCLTHCTLVPGNDRLPADFATQFTAAVSNLQIEIKKSIIGTMRVTDEASVCISNSIIDASKPENIAYTGLYPAGPDTDFDTTLPGAPLTLKNVTVIGKLHTLIMELASNTIFHAALAGTSDQWPAPVLASRLQKGCVRFCYLPAGAQVPSPFHCQTASAKIWPSFTSLRYGDAGYCQLRSNCMTEIAKGADDEAEMGVFHDLYQPQREANLKVRLDEYMRLGMEAGIFYAS